MNRNIKISSKYEVTNEVINNNFHKVKLYVQHDGLNHNATNFDKENIQKATKTLANIPILAYIKRGENGEAYDLDGHNTSLKIEEKDGELYFKEHYEESAIGIIPETNNAYFEEIDGKTYLVCFGYIWKSYANEAYDIILKNESMSVSMEIEVKSLQFKDDYVDITDYEFTGITVLGEDVPPAMDGACINMSFSKDDSFINNVKELNTYLKQELSGKEDIEMENEEKVIDETTEEETVKTKEDNVTQETETTETEEIKEDETEEVVEEIVIEEVTYSKEDIVAKFERLKELEEFKANYDAKIELDNLTDNVNEVINKFDFEEEEISELKEKAMNKEFAIETFELHLNALYGRKMREQKTERMEFSKETEKIVVGNISTEKVDDTKNMFEEFKQKYL